MMAPFRQANQTLREATRRRSEHIMPLLNGIHHVTSVTADLDRLIGFYEHIFEAPVTFDMEEDGLRHAFIQLGPHTVLHPFQIPGLNVPQENIAMFERGRLDHVALHTSSGDAFWELRRRLVAAGATDGIVTDMGSLLIFTFSDPDGAQYEVVWPKPDVPVDHTLRRAAWTTAAMG
jgi:catechol 2,3-dioxygenase-like lactoylglutathione lyase family enzyme